MYVCLCLFVCLRVCASAAGALPFDLVQSLYKDMYLRHVCVFVCPCVYLCAVDALPL